MDGDFHDVVLVVCSNEERATGILSQLSGQGISVVGPVPDAARALALSSQYLASIALIADAPVGARNAAQLAKALKETWGVNSVVLPDAHAGDSVDCPSWAPRPAQERRLKTALAVV